MNDVATLAKAGLPESIGVSPQAAQRAKAESAARSFEQVLVQSLVTELRQSGGADKMFGEGPGSDTYAQWFDQVMSERLSEGGSFGIAESVMKDLERHGEIAPVAKTSSERPLGTLDRIG